jgi:hypothetical protein
MNIILTVINPSVTFNPLKKWVTKDPSPPDAAHEAGSPFLMLTLKKKERQ